MKLDRRGIKEFGDAVERMPGLLKELVKAPRHRVAERPTLPNAPGIYLFTEHGRPIYVGQSRKLRQRMRSHTRLTANQNQASFAFNLAKKAAGEAGLDLKRFRKVLAEDPDFAAHFDQAKARVREMDLQFIELADPIERTLFEVYASLALATTEFNKFETH